MFFKPRFYLLVLLVLGGLAFNISLHASYMFQEEQLELPGLLSNILGYPYSGVGPWQVIENKQINFK